MQVTSVGLELAKIAFQEHESASTADRQTCSQVARDRPGLRDLALADRAQPIVRGNNRDIAPEQR